MSEKPLLRIVAPTNMTLTEGVPSAVTGVRLDEKPQAGETFSITLSDTNGLLSVTNGAGVSGDGTTKVTISGKMGFINKELATLEDTSSVAGRDTIMLHAKDSLGNTAAPGKIRVEVGAPSGPAFIAAMAAHASPASDLVSHTHDQSSHSSSVLAAAQR